MLKIESESVEECEQLFFYHNKNDNMPFSKGSVPNLTYTQVSQKRNLSSLH